MTEIKLLEKGLKFTPTPRNSNIPELTKDISEFTRKIRLIEFFDGCEDKDDSLVRNKSNFVPPQGREELLDNFVLNTINIPLEPIEKSNVKRNISISEQKTITALASDETIIIKQADKGGAIVIMDKEFYRRQVEKLLFDNEYYQKLDNNPQKEIMKKYRVFLKNHQTELTKKNMIILQTLSLKLVIFMVYLKFTKTKKLMKHVQHLLLII